MATRSVVDPTDPTRFAAWVRATRHRSGVYRIDNAATGATLYVGESHSDKLYGTLSRHFQVWERRKSQDPTGPIYNRNAVLVAVEETAAADALALEKLWIARYEPRDNLQFELPEIYTHAGRQGTISSDAETEAALAEEPDESEPLEIINSDEDLARIPGVPF